MASCPATTGSLSLEPVRMARRCPATATTSEGPSNPSHTVDPVCRMHLDREHAAGSLCHEGHHDWFCPLDYVAVYAANPDRYTVEPDTAE